MRNKEELRQTLMRIDGKGYKAYKDIEGEYDFVDFRLVIDHVQGDPFASPSRMRVSVEQTHSGFPADTYSSRSRAIALRDFLTRSFWRAIQRHARGNRGTGKSGVINIDRTGQEILERTSAYISTDQVEVRFVMGLPAFGRRIAARHAEAMFFSELPRIVRDALFFAHVNSGDLYFHIDTNEDADSLRDQLKDKNLIAFVADGAVLPRASGVDPRPKEKGRVVPFLSPDSLRKEFVLSHSGRISGMGIPEGVTLIVGGGYHGKSTLLKALETGIYNHIPGDGREKVVVNPQAVKIRAEDGRRVEKVDISPFIDNLPFGQDTGEFSTDDASGSTSQAANIIESLEAGAEALLIDEDTSATNFMIRDFRMQELVAKKREPITPFIDKVRQLYVEKGISTILVIGGSGDYFETADTVICMVEYLPLDVTAEARDIASRYPAVRRPEGGRHFGDFAARIPLAGSFDPRKGKKPVKIAGKGLNQIQFGVHTIDLAYVEQLVDSSQTRALGEAIHFALKYMDGRRTLEEVISNVLQRIESEGLDCLQARPVGDAAAFRGIELAAAINRLRTLRMIPAR